MPSLLKMNEVDVPCRIVVDFDHRPFHAVTVWVPVTAFQTTLVPFVTLTAWGFHLKPAVVLTPLITTAASAGCRERAEEARGQGDRQQVPAPRLLPHRR